MSDTDGEAADDGAGYGKRQLRLLGIGFALAGVVTFGLANAAEPQATLVPLLGFAGIATFVLERTQGYVSGVSFGLLAGSVGVGLWPVIGDPSLGYGYLGSVLVGAGVVNVLFAPVGEYFRKLGQRAAGGKD
ncbi:hypothetical protein [Halosegnis marinus]|uniref:SPW repeat-containing protein n=1 Tax=Halosegnis marinus TaxID=3034023 RepID=A0ABD5ZLD8_9EURY|nr:hypothetical protein [Halosegnis sp. DT85]